ncbi:cytochrome P450 4C1-like [Pseudomyrmex gracilis]|uniref:cytochrome P450 4C1-like n=1 Tax=Pseudomyrmex gracilis TaxID=219809 RepID=UPI000995486F|nr:cytochrome P450 4C1-like [Pseudomyrmex gracilis]
MDILFQIIIAVSAVLAYKIIISVYKYYITWKKLKHIPGPTSFPIIGTLEFQRLNAMEERTKWYLTLLNKYKDGIIKYWVGFMPGICLYDPNLIQVVLSSNIHINKSYDVMMLSEWLDDGLLTAKGEQWHKDRKLLTPTFHFDILKQYALTMSQKTEMMIKDIEENLKENPQQAISIIPCITKVVTNIILETAMGVNSHETISEYSEAVDRYFNFHCTRATNWIYLLMHELGPICALVPIIRQTKATITYMHNFANKIIQKRKLVRYKQNGKDENLQNDYDASDKSRRKVFLDLLLELRDNGNTSLSDKKVRAQVDTFLFAGHDTTKTSVSWALFCIGNYLKHQEKIHEELEEVFQDSQKPATVQEISQLKYLDRVIKESRRLYPTVPYIARELSEDTKIGDYIIPANIRVFILILLLHRNPAIWPDPLTFDPDRFLPENIKSMHPYAYIPFSAGPRNCIGQKFAMLEEKIILTAILRKWRIKCVETPETVIIKSAIVLVPTQGIHIEFIPKK